MLKHLASFGVGVYIGIYLDQNRQIQAVPSPREIFYRVADEADRFLTGNPQGKIVREDQFKKSDNDFFREGEDWFHQNRFQ